MIWAGLIIGFILGCVAILGWILWGQFSFRWSVHRLIPMIQNRVDHLDPLSKGKGEFYKIKNPKVDNNKMTADVQLRNERTQKILNNTPITFDVKDKCEFDPFCLVV